MDKPLRILILEDRPSDAELMEFELKEAGLNFISKRVMTEDAFLRELKEFSPDLILSDYDLPQYTGFLALAEAKSKYPDIPFILVTGAIGEDRAIEILTHGAKDYVMKSRLHRLVPAAQRALAEAEEHKARKNAEEKLRKAHRTLEKKVEKRTAELQAEIAGRKKMEEALRESEQRYRELVQSSPDAVIVHRDGMFLFANPAALRLYGSDSIEQLRRHTVIDMVHPDDRASIALRMKQLQDGERLPLGEARLLRLDGQAVPVEAVGGTVYFQGKRAVQIIIRDITGRKRVEEALAQEKLFSDAVIDSLPGIFFLIDEEGRLINWNRNAEKISGYSEEEMSSLDIMSVIAEEDRDFIVRKVQEAFVTGAATAEAHLAAKSGHKIPFYLTGTRTTIGGKQYLIGMGIDVTERKQAEEELRKRTAQLEELNRELESFSYSVSHDLHAPLRAIDGYARLILKKQGDNFDGDTLYKFNIIRNCTHMMGQLIDDLLTFSRLGRQHMSMSKLDMDAMMRDAWKELEVINPDRNMRLTVKDIPEGYGDRALIKQVCINLLSNAIKFTKYRDDAHIEAGGYTDGNENVYFVRDNGVGFDMEYYDKLFGVFQRLHSADAFEGTGVGLATVQRIIHRHGGRVWAEGKVNDGACFYFALSKQGEIIRKKVG